ncbi:MAG: Ig-like domain-containing protein [Opitutaceae bacterium]|nr:Ig-like domain-containing protein [Opitutaceae bacterium]
MKTIFRSLGYGTLLTLLFAVSALPVLAQQSPILTVSITDVDTVAGSTPNENYETYNPAAPLSITIKALAVGTAPAAGFTYKFYVNGALLGSPAVAPLAGVKAAVSWTPPEPGVYYFTVTATDGANTATSLAVRFFATGTKIISPVDNSLVPNGSSVVIQATATPQPLSMTGTNAFVQRIDFYADAVLIGSDSTYPYSIIYTPPAAPAAHTIEAQAYDSDNKLISLAGTATETLNMVTPIGTGPTCVISSPADNATVTIPTDSTSNISIAVDANPPASGQIGKVELYLDGLLFGTKSSYPYTFAWHPTVVGSYKLVALAYDDKNNVIASTTSTVPSTTPAPTTVTVAAPPTVTVTTPTAGATVTGGSPSQIKATATDPGGNPITSVQFFVDGLFVGEATTPTTGSTYMITATLTLKLDDNGVPLPSTIKAMATNSVGGSGMSAGVVVSVTSGGSGGGAPIGLPPTVSVTAPTAGASITVNTPVSLSATAADPDGNVTSVQFFVSGQSAATDAVYPYNATWTPTGLGTYSITAKATDNDGNVTTSAAVTVTAVDPSSSGPTVAISSPASLSYYTVGTPINLTATASSSGGSIDSVEYFANGEPLGTSSLAPYKFIWTPGSSGVYALTAIAKDKIGNLTTSAAVQVIITTNLPPTISLNSPAAGQSFSMGSGIVLAATAADRDGTIQQVQFFASGALIGTAPKVPYSASWTPSASGTYTVTAQATDDAGNVTTSAGATVTVSVNRAPSISLTAPANGSTVRVNSSNYLSAIASDADGPIKSVQFYINGQVIGTALTSPPYRVGWAPTSEGTYRLTAVATDNAGTMTTSDTITVLTVSAANADAVYTGEYNLGPTEKGRFACVTVGGRKATFIGHSTGGVAKTFYYPGMTINGDGGFSQNDGAGRPLISVAGSDGYSLNGGMLDNGRLILIGFNPAAFANNIFGSGYLTGSLTDRPASTLAAIVAADASIMLYVSDGAYTDVGDGKVDSSTGAFTITTSGGNTVKGTIDLTTGLVTGQLTGSVTAAFTGAPVTGGTFSDGVFSGLSTRGYVGSGANILIAGFVVDGTVAKHLIVQGIGPTLGIPSSLADPQLELYSGSTRIATNHSSLRDAAIDTVLEPGAYTALVSGFGGTTGNALVSVYDLDTLAPFSSQKVSAISTRGFVNGAGNELIAGFIINGTMSKKVLIQAVGPGLTDVDPDNPNWRRSLLGDPTLELVRMVGSAWVPVRENDDWEKGNDPALVTDAAVRSGATPLISGSKDAAILIDLPPGTYTAIVRGNNSTTGICLVQGYEVP